MNLITKVFTVIFIPLLILNLYLPKISSAYESYAADMIAKSQPEVLATPEEDIPVEKVERGGVSWLWIILGVVAVGGLAAAAGGGGGPSSPAGSNGGTGSVGTLTVNY